MHSHSREDFKDHWERFAAHLEQLERSPLTIKNYRSDLKAFWQWFKASGHAQPDLAEVSSQEMMRYQEFLLTQQKLRPSSVNRRMRTLKNFYTWLQQTGGLTRERLPHIPDPVVGVSVKRADPLSQVDQRSLLEAVQQGQNPRDRAIIKLLVHTGIRVGELCQLRWADIKIGAEQGELLVRQAKSYRDRRVVLPPEACAALLDLGYQTQVGSYAPVFVGQRGNMTPRGVQDVVKKYAQRARLEHLTPHMLRNAYATRLVEKGVSSEAIAAAMGASAEMLLPSYERLLPALPSTPGPDLD
jgi:site-specific recombinase XerD